MAESVTQTPVLSDTPEQEPETGKGGTNYVRPEETMRRYSDALTNAKADAGLLGELSKFGYNAGKIAEGEALHAKVVELFATLLIINRN